VSGLIHRTVPASHGAERLGVVSTQIWVLTTPSDCGVAWVNVDFSAWMTASLDREARRLSASRQSIIKVWIAERLERGASTA
jgi:hypothetical protein